MKDRVILRDIILYICILLIASGNIFIQAIGSLDEIWVYNFARCILDGLLPYKDFSIIITPLFPMICSIILKIFGNEMIVLRFAEMFETATILFIVYKILRRLEVNNNIAILFILGLHYIYSDVLCFDYNWAVLLITLITLYIELKYVKENLNFSFKKDLILGILVRNNSSL